MKATEFLKEFDACVGHGKTHERNEKYKGGTIMLYSNAGRFSFQYVGHPKGDLESMKEYSSDVEALSDAKRQIDRTF